MPAVTAPQEEALVFPCDGATLLGVLHHGAPDATVAVVTIVAGGPQYRGGVGRQLVFLGRELAARGIPVLRFDHRGMGDSDGDFRGFEDMADDLDAALHALQNRLPGITNIVLWGGCDAASAAFINAHRLPAVVAIAAANPWITDERMAQRVQQQHFKSRLGEWSFWKKVFTLQYNPLDYLAPLWRKLAPSSSKQRSGPISDSHNGSTAGEASFVDRMRDGLARFDGRLYLLMSGRSLISRQFDELLDDDARWRKTVGEKLAVRHEIAEADQTFSGVAAGQEMRETLVSWIEQIRDGS